MGTRSRFNRTTRTCSRTRLLVQMDWQRFKRHGWYIRRTGWQSLLCVSADDHPKEKQRFCSISQNLILLTKRFSCYRHQVINNACASIALLNATLNIKDPNVELGEELTNLQAFSDGELPSSLPFTISRARSLTRISRRSRPSNKR